VRFRKGHHDARAGRLDPQCGAQDEDHSTRPAPCAGLPRPWLSLSGVRTALCRRASRPTLGRRGRNLARQLSLGVPASPSPPPRRRLAGGVVGRRATGLLRPARRDPLRRALAAARAPGATHRIDDRSEFRQRCPQRSDRGCSLEARGRYPGRCLFQGSGGVRLRERRGELAVDRMIIDACSMPRLEAPHEALEPMPAKEPGHQPQRDHSRPNPRPNRDSDHGCTNEDNSREPTCSWGPRLRPRSTHYRSAQIRDPVSGSTPAAVTLALDPRRTSYPMASKRGTCTSSQASSSVTLRFPSVCMRGAPTASSVDWPRSIPIRTRSYGLVIGYNSLLYAWNRKDIFCYA